MRTPPATLLAWGVFCLAVLALGPLVRAQDTWQPLAEKRGVQLWKLRVPGQQLPGFRGRTLIGASIDEIIEEMLDAKHHTEWMHRCAESWIYQRGAESGILYNRTSSAPWPVWDRDVVLAVELDKSADLKQAVFRFRNLEDKLRPVPERVVRMPRLVGFYKLIQVDAQRTEVTYQVEVDIGGSIPDWIADEVAQDMPYYTLLSLRERVEDVHQRKTQLTQGSAKKNAGQLQAAAP
jgi:hypothetical protein